MHPKHTAPLLLLAALAFTGCASGPKPSPAPQAAPLKPGVYEIVTGQRLDPEAFLARLDAYRVVIVGERHDAAWDHEVQRRVYASMVARRATTPVALGMEMFQRPVQASLDAYISGAITEADMLQRTSWSTRWGFDHELYASMWRLAQQRGYPVVALNMRREVTRAVAKQGIDKLPEAMRRDLPDQLDLEHQGHRDWFRDIFRAHGMKMDEAAFERFYQAQVIWDETMAQTAWRHLQAHPAHHMLILAGSGHVLRGYGIPSRLRRRMRAAAGPDHKPGHEGVLTLIPSSKPGEATEAQLKLWQREGYADYVWVASPPQNLSVLPPLSRFFIDPGAG